jgi:type VI secretion system protein ImpM
MDDEATRPAPLMADAPTGAGSAGNKVGDTADTSAGASPGASADAGAAGAIPGWHGKLPTLGDFASRRLDPAFIEVWDGWLAAGLLRLREAQPATWLDAYLASPSWRFWLLPGALPGPAGECGWAGVLMPSVDRVGRYFPLTLALPLRQPPASPAALVALWGWLARLDELAADALHEDWSAQTLESQLAAMAAMAAPGEGAAGASRSPGDAAAHITALALHDWTQAARGQAWWLACPDGAEPRLWRSTGLPDDLIGLFGPPPASPQPPGLPAAPLAPEAAWPAPTDHVAENPAAARGRM